MVFSQEWLSQHLAGSVGTNLGDVSLPLVMSEEAHVLCVCMRMRVYLCASCAPYVSAASDGRSVCVSQVTQWRSQPEETHRDHLTHPGHLVVGVAGGVASQRRGHMCHRVTMCLFRLVVREREIAKLDQSQSDRQNKQKPEI